jgi:hypothetical protein
MDAFRAFVQQETNVLTLSLPETWVGRRLEVLVLPANEPNAGTEQSGSEWAAWVASGPQGPLDSSDGFLE